MADAKLTIDFGIAGENNFDRFNSTSFDKLITALEHASTTFEKITQNVNTNISKIDLINARSTQDKTKHNQNIELLNARTQSALDINKARQDPAILNLRQQSIDNISKLRAERAADLAFKQSLYDKAQELQKTDSRTANKIYENLSANKGRGRISNTSFLQKLIKVGTISEGMSTAAGSIRYGAQEQLSAMQNPYLNNYNYGNQYEQLQNLRSQQRSAIISSASTIAGSFGGVYGAAIGYGAGQIYSALDTCSTSLRARSEATYVNNLTKYQSLQSTNANATNLINSGDQHKFTDQAYPIKEAIAKVASAYSKNVTEVDKLTVLFRQAQLPIAQIPSVTKNMSILNSYKGFNSNNFYSKLAQTGTIDNINDISAKTQLYLQAGINPDQATNYAISSSKGINPTYNAWRENFSTSSYTDMAQQETIARNLLGFSLKGYAAGNKKDIGAVHKIQNRLKNANGNIFAMRPEDMLAEKLFGNLNYQMNQEPVANNQKFKLGLSPLQQSIESTQNAITENSLEHDKSGNVVSSQKIIKNYLSTLEDSSSNLNMEFLKLRDTVSSLTDSFINIKNRQPWNPFHTSSTTNKADHGTIQSSGFKASVVRTY
jgi:hypothetical protein